MNDYERFIEDAQIAMNNLGALNAVDSDMQNDVLDAEIYLERAINKAEDRV